MISFGAGVFIGFLIAAFMSGAGAKNKQSDYYNEGYIDGFKAGKAKGEK